MCEREREKKASGVFYYLILEIIYHYFCHILLVKQINPCTMWEGTLFLKERHPT